MICTDIQTCPMEATTVMKPQLIQNLHYQELSAIKYYKTGRKNKWTLRVFDFNDSFFYKMYNKTIYYFCHNYKTNSLIKCKIKAVFWNKQNTLPPSQETRQKDKAVIKLNANK